MAQDLFWFLGKNGLFDRDLTDQHLLNHVIDALDATLERCLGNTECQAYYLSLVSTLIQSIIFDNEKTEPFHIDEDLIEACRAMREEGITVIEERRARLEEEKQKRMRAAIDFAASGEANIERGGRPSEERGRGSPLGNTPTRGGRGGMEAGRGRDSPAGRGGRGNGTERGRGGPTGGATPPNRGRSDLGPPRGRGAPPRGPGRDASPAGAPPGAYNSGSIDIRDERITAPPTDNWEEQRRPSNGANSQMERDGAPITSSVNAHEERKKRPELRRTATGDSLLASFLRRLYFIAERIFIEMHVKIMDTISPLLIPAILSHPNPGNSIPPPKPGASRIQRTHQSIHSCQSLIFIDISNK